MAECYPGKVVAANGSGRRWLHDWEACILYKAVYPVRPVYHVASEWRVSAGGLLMHAVPVGQDRLAEIEAFLAGMTEEEREDPRWHPDKHAAWTAYFTEHHERELVAYDGTPSAPAWQLRRPEDWWGAPGRTLAAVLEHIENDNQPQL